MSNSDTKKCPDCAEFIKLEAKVCKHCGKKQSLPKNNSSCLGIIIKSIIGTLLFFFIINQCSSNTTPTKTTSTSSSGLLYVSIIDYVDIANDLGTSVNSSSVQNYRVNLWSKSNKEGKGVIVSNVEPGTYLALVKEYPNSYLVVNYKDKSTGYVSKVQTNGVKKLSALKVVNGRYKE